MEEQNKQAASDKDLKDFQFRTRLTLLFLVAALVGAAMLLSIDLIGLWALGLNLVLIVALLVFSIKTHQKSKQMLGEAYKKRFRKSLFIFVPVFIIIQILLRVFDVGERIKGIFN